MPVKAPPNVYRVDGDVAYIGMRDGYEAKILVVDLGKVMPFNWSARARDRPRKRTPVYVIRAGYWDQSLHRLILNAPKGKQGDHRNGDGLDNRKVNLRLVNNQQNMQNRPKGANRNSKSGIRGVCKFVATGGKEYWIGRVARPKPEKSPMTYYPFTDEGKQAAAEWVMAKRAELMTHSEEQSMTWYWTATREDGSTAEAESEFGWQEVLTHQDVCDGANCGDAEIHAARQPSRLTQFTVDTGAARVDVQLAPNERLAFARRVSWRYGVRYHVIGKRHPTHAMASEHIGDAGTTSKPGTGAYTFLGEDGKIALESDDFLAG